MAVQKSVVNIARLSRERLWTETGSASDGTRLSTAVTRDWQDGVKKRFGGDRFRAEVQAGKAATRHRLDLLDTQCGVAYEFKVSANNPHHEFFRDIFKVVAFNEASSTKVQRLVFIAPASAVQHLKAGLGAVAQRMARRLGFVVDLEGV